MARRRHRCKGKGSRSAQPNTVHPDAAGLDLGSTEVYAAVRPERDPDPIRNFPTLTADLHALADWLKQCQVTTVEMESTGVYWIPVLQILEAHGFEVVLVNARHVHSVPGRKSDVTDCENGCATCTRWDCCAARSAPLTRCVCCARCCAIATP